MNGTSGVSGTRRRWGARAAVITTATVVASVLGYVLLTVIGRWGLTPAEFGLFLVFWGVIFGIGGALATTEQEAARRTATGDETSHPTVGAVMAAAAVLAAVAAGLTLVPFVSRRLYGGYEPGIAFIVLAAVIGFAIQFAVRGTLIGSGMIRGYSAIVIAEAAIRLVVLAILAVTIGLNPTSTAVAVASGSLVWLFWFRRFGSIVRTVVHGPFELATAVGRAASLMGGAALLASVVTGYPTMVTLFSGETPGPAGGAAFAALTISRVPLVFIVPIQALTVPVVVSWQAATDGGARIRRLLTRGTLAALTLGGLGGAIAWPIGPALVRFVYGPAYEVPHWVVAVLILSAVLLGWVALVSAALIALSAIRRMVLLWLAVAGATAVWLIVSPLGVVETTAVGTVVGPLVGIACGVPMLWSSALPATGAPTDLTTEGVGD